MVKNFFSRPNVFVRLLVVLIFVGGLVFAATYDGFSPKIQAENSSCCGGTDAAPTEEPVAQAEVSGCCGGGTDALLADGTVEQPEVSSNSGIDASVAGFSGKDCECTKNNCPAPEKKCKGCSDGQQWRCRDGCPKGNACHSSCMSGPDYICNGAKQCGSCGVSSC